MRPIGLGLVHMTSGNQCQVKDDLVNQLIALNNKLNTLSPLCYTASKRERKSSNNEKTYTSKSSATGRKDTEANLVQPSSVSRFDENQWREPFRTPRMYRRSGGCSGRAEVLASDNGDSYY
jgi:hypothetical protein